MKQFLQTPLKLVPIAAALLLPWLLPGLALAAPDLAGGTPGGARPPLGLTLWFYVIGGLTVAFAVATITRRNPVVAAVCLVATLLSSAGLYLLLHATFLAAMQVLVYAGAIMVLFIFVIMAVENPEKEQSGLMQATGTKVVGLIAMLFFLFRVVSVVMGREAPMAAVVPGDFGNVSQIGRLLFNEYLLPFEAISLLLLTAIVGAVVVSRKRAQERNS